MPVSKQVSGPRVFAVVFVVAVLVNYLWELAQAPLFGDLNLENVWLHCLVASLGDGLIVLLILVIGWCVHRRLDWFFKPGIYGYLVMVVSGLIIAILIEWIAVHVVRRWSYTSAMPLLPFLDIGIVPIAQMLLLPPFIFRVARVWIPSRSSEHQSCTDTGTG